MKTFSLRSIYLEISLIFVIFSFDDAFAQSTFLGNWEGFFMGNFKAEITFEEKTENIFTGNIKMFDGDIIIQDDKLENILFSQNQLTFYIPEKETSFEGNFNEPFSELIGVFIFPDGSRHPIDLKRKISKAATHEDFRALKKQKMDAKELRSDLQFLFAALKEHHPQLDSFSFKDSIHLLYKNIESKMDKPLTLEEFYFQTAQLTDAVHCSHTGVRLPSSYQNLIEQHGNYFPLKLFFTNGKAFFINGRKEDNKLMLPGYEIISINHKPIQEIINQCFYYVPSEACNTTTKYNELNKNFHTLYYLIDDSEEFLVKFKSEGITEQITIPSARFADLDSASEITDKPYEFISINDGAIGMLRVSSFAIRNMDHYLSELDRIFDDLKERNVRNLILDLRDNAGGHPIFAAQLYSYLTNKEFVYFIRNEKIKDFEPLYNTMAPNELNFTGNIYAFVNGGCLSTAGHLISLLKFNTPAIFIGEQPGSTNRCNDFSLQLTLANSGIQINIPRTTFETAVTDYAPCHPFPLDFKIQSSVKDKLNGEDLYLKTFIEIMNN